MGNSKILNKIKKNKNDEFYTLMEDIEKELQHHKDYLKNKIVYCNCDNENSNFYKYFYNNFDDIGLKKLITTHYVKDGKSYKIEVFKKNDKIKVMKSELKGDGDFRSPECIELLKECDIVITNPPFSLFREFIDILIKHNKKFLVIGSKIAMSYHIIFNLFKEGKIWFGYNTLNKFLKNNGIIKGVGGAQWYCNIPVNKKIEKLKLTKKYDENKISKV